MTASMLPGLAAVTLFPAAMIYAGIMDVLTMRIRNALVLAIVALYAVLAPLAGFSLVEIGQSLAVAGVVFALTFALFSFGWIGGGDAKLASAAALWFGWDHALDYFLVASLFGGALTFAILGFRRMLLPATFCRSAWILRLHESRQGVPYGAALAPAALVVFPETAWFAAL